MGVQAENWLSEHNPTKDHRECHPRSPLCPPIRELDLLWHPECLAYIPSVTSYAAGQSQSGSITITQQLCVFIEDYIFKRTPGGEGRRAQESSVTDYEGARSRVQKSRGPHPWWPCCVGKSTHTMCGNMADCVVVISLVFLCSFSLSLSVSLTTVIPFMQRGICCQAQIMHQEAKNWHRMICLVSCSWTVVRYYSTTVITILSTVSRCETSCHLKSVHKK